MIKRNINNQLQEWRAQIHRKPLLIRGARQVGKSSTVRALGATFEYFVELNLEKDLHAQHLFSDNLDAKRMASRISAYTDMPLIPGKTLLFIDEIQACERAILALRYFKEEMPDLHVIAAGSLIDFTLHAIGMPVGRVSFLHMYPLHFGEYCHATGHGMLYDQAQSETLPDPLHEKLLSAFKNYAFVGGMPEVVATWATTDNMQQCRHIQNEIIFAYQQDFNKYAKSHQIDHLEKVLNSMGHQLGQKFKYASVDPLLRAKDLRAALLLLEKANILHVVYHSTAQALPLAAGENHKRFKAYLFDVGLLQNMMGVTGKTWLQQPLDVTYRGAIAEQLAAQELIAHMAPHQPAKLHYWHREAKQSNAEVDFVHEHNEHIIPIEVKATHGKHMKSMYQFLNEHPTTPYGLKVSSENTQVTDHIRGIPIYAIEGWLKSGA